MSRRSPLPSLWRHPDEAMPFRSIRKEIDRVFDEFHRGFPVPAMTAGVSAGRQGVTPRIDVSETDGAVEITAELPGVEQEDIDVTLADNVLTIKGEKKSEREDEKRNYHVVERSYGAFRRAIRLPFETNAKKVEARFKDGVLKIVLPKPSEVEAKSRKIAIKSGA